MNAIPTNLMTCERAKELLPVIQAFANGEEIQSKNFNHTKWTDIQKDWIVDFSQSNYEYRIKPKPREWWIMESLKNGEVIGGPCRKPLNPPPSDYHWIHVREVSD
jgi:hypothetical protein